jgi:hypothetical protein
MSLERVLITVKTYPTLSKKYGETVCTAGLREDGSWVRIYPVPFRRIEDFERRYSKFDWVECDLIQNTAKDKRPESRRPTDLNSLKVVGHIDTKNSWKARRKFVLGKGGVFSNLQGLIDDAKADKRSLATFKPTKILEFFVEDDDREWDDKKLAEMRKQLNQPDLFEDSEWQNTFRVIDKLPYKFSYRLIDDSGKESTMRILDWEIGALFWRYGRANEELAIEKVREKYMDKFLKTDIHLFLGTTQQWHNVAPNPWVIVGVAPFPIIDPSVPDQPEFSF